MIASTEGITLTEAITRYGWQRQFSDVAGVLESQYPASFAGAEMVQTGTPRGVIHFVGAVPPGVRDLVARVQAQVDLVSDGLYARSDVDSAVQNAHYAALDAAGGLGVSSEFDDASNTIVTTLYDTAELAAVDRVPAVRQELRVVAEERSALPQIPIKIVTAGDKGVGQDVIRGGALLGGSSASSFACTSGWSVFSVTENTSGLVTADHCPNSMSYSGRGVLSYVRSVDKNAGDVQYMRSSEGGVPEFYFGVGDYRTVTGRGGTPAIGFYLCKFGRTSGNTCDEVRNRGTCRNSYCNLVSMQNRKADSGDSGGPWYYGATAYGVHSGYHTELMQGRDQWSPLNITLGNLGVKLRTG